MEVEQNNLPAREINSSSEELKKQFEELKVLLLEIKNLVLVPEVKEAAKPKSGKKFVNVEGPIVIPTQSVMLHDLAAKIDDEEFCKKITKAQIVEANKLLDKFQDSPNFDLYSKEGVKVLEAYFNNMEMKAKSKKLKASTARKYACELKSVLNKIVGSKVASRHFDEWFKPFIESTDELKALDMSIMDRVEDLLETTKNDCLRIYCMGQLDMIPMRTQNFYDSYIHEEKDCNPQYQNCWHTDTKQFISTVNKTKSPFSQPIPDELNELLLSLKRPKFLGPRMTKDSFINLLSKHKIGCSMIRQYYCTEFYELRYDNADADSVQEEIDIAACMAHSVDMQRLKYDLAKYGMTYFGDEDTGEEVPVEEVMDTDGEGSSEEEELIDSEPEEEIVIPKPKKIVAKPKPKAEKVVPKSTKGKKASKE